MFCLYSGIVKHAEKKRERKEKRKERERGKEEREIIKGAGRKEKRSLFLITVKYWAIIKKIRISSESILLY